jgi:hypothetical protein
VFIPFTENGKSGIIYDEEMMKMKKVLAIILSILAVFSTVTTSAEEEKGMEESQAFVYVSPNGDDMGDGNLKNPLKTLSAARDKARELKEYYENVTVFLRGGEYALNECLTLDGRDSYETWTAFENETPIVTSATKIENWEIYDIDKNIYKASVPEGFDTRSLYVDGKKALRARNTSYEGNPYEHLKRTCELGLNSRNNKELYFYADDVSDWNNFENVEVHLLTAWTDNLLRLAKYDDEKNFRETYVDNKDEGVVKAAAVKISSPESDRLFSRPHPDITGSTLGYKSRSYYYFENAYEFIDEDFEWYLDKSKSVIYFKAPDALDMAKASITAPTLETLVEISGNAENKALNVTFKNITFECTSWLRGSVEGLVGGQSCQYVLTSDLDNNITVCHPTSGFFAEYADNLKVEGCTFKNMGATAIDFFQGVTNSEIYSNEICFAAGNGISAAKFTQDETSEFHTAYNPSDKSEICENISIVNNSVHDIGTEYEGAVAIACGYPKKITVAHNEIYNTPYSGISVGFGWTSEDNAMSENVIFANKIHDIGLVTCDFGAIYTLSKQPGSLCAKNCIYNIGRKNWFDYGYTAMYFDEQTEGYTITENVTYNVGSDAWGSGINFNGCASKNSSKNNILNAEPDSDSAVKATEETGIFENESCEALVKEARNYLFEVKNPKEVYNESDYYADCKITPVAVSATGCDDGSSPLFAVDSDPSTVYTLSGQTASSIKDEYLLVELDGKENVEKIIIDRQYNAGGKTGDNSYWADWCLAVGCEIQGSFDNKTWETIGVMNTWPDNTGEKSREVFELEEAKAYKYIRYIRTKYKTGSDYAVWRWSDDGGNRLNVKDISFYGKAPCKKVEIKAVSATGCDEGSSPLFAVDSDPSTVYTLSGQTASSIKDEYLLVELDGKEEVKKIIIRRQYNAGGKTGDDSYWADWCLAVGCEIQGSFDNKTWETIGVMNTWPDNTGEESREVFELEEAKAYKYIRYIRTKYKTGSDYAVWRWSDDGGNRLNVKELEIYTLKEMPEILSIEPSGDKASVKFKGEDLDGVLILASYSEDGQLLSVSCAEADDAGEKTLNISQGAKRLKAMIWTKEAISPVCEAADINLD